MRSVLLIVVVLSAPITASTQSAAACPAARVDTSGWITVTADSPMVEFRLPAEFKRKFYDVVVGTLPPRQEWRRDPWVTLVIEERPGPDSIARATSVRSPSVENYSECTETVFGARAIIQAQRGGGTIFDNGKRMKSFDAYATIERRPGLYVRVRAHAASQRDQEQLLAIIRTVRLR